MLYFIILYVFNTTKEDKSDFDIYILHFGAI